MRPLHSIPPLLFLLACSTMCAPKSASNPASTDPTPLTPSPTEQPTTPPSPLPTLQPTEAPTGHPTLGPTVPPLADCAAKSPTWAQRAATGPEGVEFVKSCLAHAGVDASDLNSPQLVARVAQAFDENEPLKQGRMRLYQGAKKHAFNALKITTHRTHLDDAFYKSPRFFSDALQNGAVLFANLYKSLPALRHYATEREETNSLTWDPLTFVTTWDIEEENPSLSLTDLLAPQKRLKRPQTLEAWKNGPVEALFLSLDSPQWPQQWAPKCETRAGYCQAFWQGSEAKSPYSIEVHQFWNEDSSQMLKSPRDWAFGVAFVWDGKDLKATAEVDLYGNIRSIYTFETQNKKEMRSTKASHYDSNFHLLYVSHLNAAASFFQFADFVHTLGSHQTPVAPLSGLGICKSAHIWPLMELDTENSLINGPYPLRFDENNSYLSGSLLGWTPSFDPKLGDWRYGAFQIRDWKWSDTSPILSDIADFNPEQDRAYFHSAKRVWPQVHFAIVGEATCAQGWESFVAEAKIRASNNQPALRVMDGFESEYVVELGAESTENTTSSLILCHDLHKKMLDTTKNDILWTASVGWQSKAYLPKTTINCAARLSGFADNVLSVAGMPKTTPTRPSDTNAFVRADVGAFLPGATTKCPDACTQATAHAQARVQVSTLAARLAQDLPGLSPQWIRLTVMGASITDERFTDWTRAGGWVDVSEEGYARLKSLGSCVLEPQRERLKPFPSFLLESCLTSALGMPPTKAKEKSRLVFRP